MELTQEMPHSPSLEETVLGTILTDNTAIYKVAQHLSEDCFYINKNRLIYNAIIKLFNQKQQIDIVTVTEQLIKMGIIDKIGGPYHLVELTNKVGSAAHLETHSIMLYEYYQRRDLIENCGKIARMAYDPSNDVPMMIEQTRKKLFANSNIGGSKIVNMNTVVEQLAKDATDSNFLYQQVRGIPSGYEVIDTMLSGWIKGRFYVIGGRPSMGKTTFVLNAAANAAKMFGGKGLIFSGEMQAEDITKTIIAQQTGIEIDKISQNAITSNNWDEILKRFGGDFGKNLQIDDTAGPSILHIESESIRMVQKEEVKFIIVDYLQLVTVSTVGPKIDKVALISNRLKALAKNLDVPVIALSQLSRECEKRPNKRPVLSDLREAGDIEQDADIIAFLYRPEYYGTYQDAKGNSLKNLVEFIIAKNKFGPIGTVLLYYERPIGRFSPYDVRNMCAKPIESYDKSITMPKRLGEKSIAAETLTLPFGVNEDDIPF